MMPTAQYTEVSSKGMKGYFSFHEVKGNRNSQQTSRGPRPRRYRVSIQLKRGFSFLNSVLSEEILYTVNRDMSKILMGSSGAVKSRGKRE